jgi:acyl carrier protein
MNREDLTKILAEWIGEIMEQEPPTLTSETDLIKDLSLDSLSLAELAARLRIRYKIHIRPSELLHRMQVGALIDLIEQKLSEKPQ